nr:unnamed protein product [Callosobruchus analis]
MEMMISNFQVIDLWKRTADTMGNPIHELNKKKDNFMATFRINFKKELAFMKSGTAEEEVYLPIWIFYAVMVAFLKDVSESTSLLNTDTEADATCF